VEAGAHPARRVDAQVAPHLRAGGAKARAQEQLRGAERPTRQHHRPPRAGLERSRARAVAASGHAGEGVDSDGALPVEDEPLCLDPGAHPRAGGDCPRQVRHVHRALCVEAAAVGTGAALHAIAGVPVQGPVADAERLCALPEQLSVAPHPRGIDGLDVQHPLRLCVVGIEVLRPFDPVFARPAGEGAVGRAEARARVDHGGPAHDAAHRGRNGRLALGHGQTPVAIHGGQRRQRLFRIALAIHVGPGLEHQYLMARLREHRGGNRPAGTGADHEHVAVLGAAVREQVAERIGPGHPRRGTTLVGHAAGRLVADRLAHPRVVCVGEARQHLEKQERVLLQPRG
jgi:hypothetical protein